MEPVFAGGDCALSTPEASDYCASYTCGKCGLGEGDCDPGQCKPGLECVEEGAVDHCRVVTDKASLEVLYNGAWRGICCVDGLPELSHLGCWWTEYDRTLTDDSVGLKLDCPEGDPTACACDWDGERLHGINGWDLDASILDPNGGPVYPDYTQNTCLFVQADGTLATEWTDATCLDFRLQ